MRQETHRQGKAAGAEAATAAAQAQACGIVCMLAVDWWRHFFSKSMALRSGADSRLQRVVVIGYAISGILWSFPT
jgi:hypothetical protein